jgi:hypothetical protein
MHPRIARSVDGLLVIRRNPRLAVVGPEEDVRARDDIHHAVAVEVVAAGAPAVVELAQLLFAEPARHDFRRTRLQRQVRVADALELRGRRAAHPERDHPVAPEVVVGGPTGAGVVDVRAEDVRVEQHLEVVPLTGTNAGRGRRNGQRGSCAAARAPSSASRASTSCPSRTGARRAAPARAASGRRGRVGIDWSGRRWRDANLAAAGAAKGCARQFLPLRVERDAEQTLVLRIPFSQRHEHALHARGVFSARSRTLACSRRRT